MHSSAAEPTSEKRLNTVAILGAGTMGAYIGYLCAKRGYTVRLLDNSPAALKKARASQETWAAMEIADGPAREAALARVDCHDSLDRAVEGADLVIETLPENLELKRRVFAQLDALCPPPVILASNSSSLRMSLIETGVRHRERVANLHFFPPSFKPLEIMGGSATSTQTIERLVSFALSLELVPFVLRAQSTGFLYGRLWHAIKKEVLREIAEGVATPEEIDLIVMMTWHWDKGPFGWMDLVGLDVVRDIENVYHEESGDSRDRPPAFLDEMIARGELGAKTGKGFYTYPNPAYAQPGFLEPGAAKVSSGVSPSTRADFIGAWRLVCFEMRAADGVTHPLGPNAQGYLIYTPTGQMSVVLSKPDRAAFGQGDMLSGTSEEKVSAFDSCFSYFGTFEVGEGQVIHRIEHCTFPNWIGTEQVRFFELAGNRLTLRTPPMQVGGGGTVSRLIWERLAP